VVFIRPGWSGVLTRKRLNPGKHSCPIHRFYMKRSALESDSDDVQDLVACTGWLGAFSGVCCKSRECPVEVLPIQTEFLSPRAGAPHHCVFRNNFFNFPRNRGCAIFVQYGSELRQMTPQITPTMRRSADSSDLRERCRLDFLGGVGQLFE